MARSRASASIGVVLGALLPACAASFAARAPSGSARTHPTPHPAPSAALLPAARASGFAALRVPGFLPALVWTPPARSGRAPLLVATHGAGGTPEWDCEQWAQRVGRRAFVLCPRGKGIVASGERGYYYPNHHDLDREVLAAVAALRVEAGDRVDTERVVYAGYSQGATMGALMVREHAALFPRLVLVEGGFAEWTLGVARRYRAGGGERVLFVCGTTGCSAKAKRSARWLEQAGVNAALEYAAGAGHTADGAVADRVAARLEWVVEGDVRWGSVVSR